MMFKHLHPVTPTRLGGGCLLAVLGTLGLCISHGARAENGEASRVKVVEASGAGTDVDSARKDACREAVRQVVGAYVNARTRTENDELIEDKVISLSSGFVEKVESLKESTSDGVVRVKIRATVRISRVLESLKENTIAVSDVDGVSLGAELLTKVDQRQGADELIEAAFEGFPAKWFKVSVVGKPWLGDPSGGDKTPLFVTVMIEPDREAFLASITKLDEALKATERPGGEFAVAGEESGFNEVKQEIVSNSVRHMLSGGRGFTENGPFGQAIGFIDIRRVPDAWGRMMRVRFDQNKNAIAFPVKLVAADKWTQWKWYGLTLDEAERLLRPIADRNIVCEATLVGDNDSEIDVSQQRLEGMGVRRYREQTEPYLLGPGLIVSESGVVTKYTCDLKFLLIDEEIRNIRKVRVTLR